LEVFLGNGRDPADVISVVGRRANGAHVKLVAAF